MSKGMAKAHEFVILRVGSHKRQVTFLLVIFSCIHFAKNYFLSGPRTRNIFIVSVGFVPNL